MNSRHDGDPYSQVCAVSITLPEENNTVEGTSSGILIDTRQGLVLTHSSVLYPLADKLQPDILNRLLREGTVDTNIFASQINVEVILPNNNMGQEDTSYFTNDKTIHAVNLLSSSVHNARPFDRYKAKLKTIFACTKLKDTLVKLMPSESWQFMEDVNIDQYKTKQDDNTTANKEQLCYALLPYFILIKLHNFYPTENVLSIRNSEMNKHGDPVEICATPFGSMSPDVFLNARSRGILSKMAGPQNVLLMTDARCVPGSEGGAVFYCHKGKRLLTGIVIASLCWKNNEWVGLSLACAISEVLGSLKSPLTIDLERCSTMQYIGGLDQGMVPELIKKVICVNVGHNWGSGVVIDSRKGIVLTCSHVLNGVNYSGVRVTDLGSYSPEPCNVLYRTPLKSQFDIALIQHTVVSTQHTNEEHIQLTFGKALEGEVVYVIGHAIFRGGTDVVPMVTRGIVSKVVRYNNVPVMLQTTCAVHAGASGGGVFNTHGHLIAMVVCNSKDSVSGACYPHINMCVPMETVASTIKQYIQTEDSALLRSLHVRNDAVRRIWSIGTEDCGILSRI